jgi:hypothetical protein
MLMTRFTKLSAGGAEMSDTATGHVAVRDNTTGLIWQAGDSGKDLKHKQAAAYCKKLKLLDAKDWRLPTVDELFALADRTKVNPAIDQTFFPNCPSGWFWTSTPYAGAPADAAWVVNFLSGYASWFSHYDGCRARAVRSGQ